MCIKDTNGCRRCIKKERKIFLSISIACWNKNIGLNKNIDKLFSPASLLLLKMWVMEFFLKMWCDLDCISVGQSWCNTCYRKPHACKCLFSLHFWAVQPCVDHWAPRSDSLVVEGIREAMAKRMDLLDPSSSSQHPIGHQVRVCYVICYLPDHWLENTLQTQKVPTNPFSPRAILLLLN